MKVLRGGWYAICILCACVHLSITQDNLYFGNWRIHEPKKSEYQAYKEPEYDEPSRGFHRKLIPIKAPRMNKNSETFKLPLEPEAEMLPAHYTGVKPPGVDHMELRLAESRVYKVVPVVQQLKILNQAGDAQQVSRAQVLEQGKDQTLHQKTRSFEKGQKGNYLKEKKKTKYTEAGGKKKSHDDGSNKSGQRAEQTGGNSGANYEKKIKDQSSHKKNGYRNVYHKDESNKSHDFYDNDDHGGHTKKHGRYKEKHVMIEGTYKKGGVQNSGHDAAQLHKHGITGNSRVDGESRGHQARHGYDGFLKNFQVFGNQAARNEGKRFGFGHTKAP
ncbi:uncharacterized protein LOC108621930 [Ceratina calcarata]|uniref:Uncharacterized protein LOC108621930 n=1 Tax=Ceratina calcarata TaxID=156304 RepID=A0AAJ7RX51_9HYME|nr:uncharacterized protein LOC108621930 [Ceratina calcarata]